MVGGTPETGSTHKIASLPYTFIWMGKGSQKHVEYTGVCATSFFMSLDRINLKHAIAEIIL